MRKMSKEEKKEIKHQLHIAKDHLLEAQAVMEHIIREAPEKVADKVSRIHSAIAIDIEEFERIKELLKKLYKGE